jgi:hypothetical protein
MSFERKGPDVEDILREIRGTSLKVAEEVGICKRVRLLLMELLALRRVALLNMEGSSSP